MNLNCVNKWCKYQKTNYCQESCGSFVKENTTLEQYFSILKNKDDIAILDFNSNSILIQGHISNILNKIKEYSNYIIKELHFDESGKTFCIWIS